MARQATAQPDFVPHLPNLILSMANCWRAIGDAQTEVDPFGVNYTALREAREAIEAAVDRITGQSGFLFLAGSGAPQKRHPSILVTRQRPYRPVTPFGRPAPVLLPLCHRPRRL